MLTIKVLGPGCANCKKVEANTLQALEALKPQPEFEIMKVTDRQEIMRYILATPGLVINEKVVAAARIPEVAEIQEWLAEATQASQQ